MILLFSICLEIISVVRPPDPKIVLFISAAVADAATVRPSTLNGLITDFNKGNPDFNNGAKILKIHLFTFYLIVLLTI